MPDAERLIYAMRAAIAQGPTGFDWFRPVTRYIVIRGTGAEQLDGVWIDRPPSWPFAASASPGDMVVAATGRYERRGDGMLAEIYEPSSSGEIDD